MGLRDQSYHPAKRLGISGKTKKVVTYTVRSLIVGTCAVALIVGLKTHPDI